MATLSQRHNGQWEWNEMLQAAELWEKNDAVDCEAE